MSNIVLPPSPKSDANSPEVVCLSFTPAAQEVAPIFVPFLSTAVSYAVGAITDHVGKAIEYEANRYKASYTSRASGFLLRKLDSGEVRLNIQGFTLSRYHGDTAKIGCPLEGTNNSDLTARFEAQVYDPSQLYVSTDKRQLKIIPTAFSLKRTKSKLAYPRPYYPWTWWLYFDSSSRKIDMDIQVTLTTIGQQNNGRIGEVTLLRTDIPLGTIDMSRSVSFNAKALAHLASETTAIPALEPSESSGDFMPVNLTVTVIEASNLGDVLAKAADDARKSRGTVSEELLKALRIKEVK